MKHPVRSFAVQNLNHLPTKSGDFCDVDFYLLDASSFDIYICFDLFSKFVNLCPLKVAASTSRLNKILNHYVVNVTRPKCILSYNGTQFV